MVRNSVQETLVIPLFGRLVCSEHFPKLFSDPEVKRICGSLDYDFADKRGKIKSAAGMFYYFRTAEVKKLFQVIPEALVGWLVTVIL